MKILLDYFFPITQIEPIPSASTAFLKQICLVVNPASGVTINVPTLCTTMAQVEALTDNEDAQSLFDAGLTRIYVLPSADLDLADVLASDGSNFFTLAISSDFDDTDLGSLDIGSWKGVVGFASETEALLDVEVLKKNRSGFLTNATNGVKNMLHAFGKLLLNQTNWLNQQYISMPEAGEVVNLGDANNLFDKRISFVMNDSEYGNRLGFFAAGGQAIVAPYIIRNLEIDMQSAALQYIANNMPQYTLTEAALVEDELQKVILSYIERGWLEDGSVSVRLEQQNFVASGYIEVPQPKAMWRIFGELRQS